MKKSKEIYEAIGSSLSALANEETYDNLSKDNKGNSPMPSVARLQQAVTLCREIIFPGYFAGSSVSSESLQFSMGVNIEQLSHILLKEVYAGICVMESRNADFDKKEAIGRSNKITAEFIEWLPELRRLLCGDIDAMFVGDPAATSISEIILAYPATRAISSYRIAHRLNSLGAPLIPLTITEMAHSETGIDIHPCAQIGERFSIDHGTGVVVGATCVIGDDVKLYQGVTLGAKSFPLDENGKPVKGIPRHPIIGNGVVVYAQATILGRVTIGDNSVIGGNVWLTRDVAAGEVVSQMDCQAEKK